MVISHLQEWTQFWLHLLINFFLFFSFLVFADKQVRNEAILKRATDKESNIRDKRRSWSAARDSNSPSLSQAPPRSVIPRGRSTDRGAMNRPSSSAGGGSLTASRRLSSSTTNLERRVKLIRLGPFEEDWFECHVTTVSAPKRRSSSPGKEETVSTSAPHHHLSTPNLACKPYPSSPPTNFLVEPTFLVQHREIAHFL